MLVRRSSPGGWSSGGVLALPARPQRASVNAALIAIFLTAFTSLLVVAGGPGIRLAVAIGVGFLLVTIARIQPGLGIIATFVYLVVLGMLRRVLLGASDWISGDPLLLVAPFVALLLIARAFALEHRPIAPDAISWLVILLLGITFAEVFNPYGGGIAAGVAGLVFMAFPLFWFFPGREYLRDVDIERIMGVVVALGIVVAVYGLWQLFLGHPPWDQQWLELPSTMEYSSLNVGGEIRAFASFASFGEYGLFLATALVVCVWFVTRGKLVALLPIPLLGAALFLSGGRQPLLLGFLGVVVMLGLRTGAPRKALLVTSAALVLAAGAAVASGPLLSSVGANSGAFVGRQLGAIADPLDPNSSTLLIHLELAFAGIKTGVTHPIGLGTAATNNAAGVGSSEVREKALDTDISLGQDSSGTDIDISNAFVSYGAGGGLLFVVIILTTLATAVRAFFRGHSELLPVIGVLVANLGYWGNGGNYALAALVWMLVGVVAARGRQSRAAARAPAA